MWSIWQALSLAFAIVCGLLSLGGLLRLALPSRSTIYIMPTLVSALLCAEYSVGLDATFVFGSGSTIAGTYGVYYTEIYVASGLSILTSAWLVDCGVALLQRAISPAKAEYRSARILTTIAIASRVVLILCAIPAIVYIVIGTSWNVRDGSLVQYRIAEVIFSIAIGLGGLAVLCALPLWTAEVRSYGPALILLVTSFVLIVPSFSLWQWLNPHADISLTTQLGLAFGLRSASQVISLLVLIATPWNRLLTPAEEFVELADDEKSQMA